MAKKPSPPGEFRRVSILLREGQHQNLIDRKENYSALVRRLIDDHFANNKIEIKLSPGGLKQVQEIASLIEISEQEYEEAFLKSLKQGLQKKLRDIEKVMKQL